MKLELTYKEYIMLQVTLHHYIDSFTTQKVKDKYKKLSEKLFQQEFKEK